MIDHSHHGQETALLPHEEVEHRQKKKSVDRILLYNRLERSEGADLKHLLNVWLYLWAPDERGRCCPNIQIRNTLLIYDGVPCHWLFQTPEGKIMKKYSTSIKDRNHIFQKLKSECLKNQCPVRALQVVLDRSPEGVTINVLNEQEMKALLTSSGPMPDGVLSAYPVHFSDPNVLITATWFPNFFHIERQVMRPKRVHSLSGGPEASSNMNRKTLSDGNGVSINLIEAKLKAYCDSLIRHITKISPQKYLIDCMRLLFKQDDKGTMWFVHCSVLELRPFSDPLQRPLLHCSNNFTHIPRPRPRDTEQFLKEKHKEGKSEKYGVRYSAKNPLATHPVAQCLPSNPLSNKPHTPMPLSMPPLVTLQRQKGKPVLHLPPRPGTAPERGNTHISNVFKNRVAWSSGPTATWGGGEEF